MNKILNFYLVQNAISNFGWHKCSFINEFRFFIGRNEYFDEISILEIVFQYSAHEDYLIKVQFKELGNYELRAGGSRIQLISFEIEDIRDHGLNEINYRIKDYERDEIQLYCKEIEIISIDNC
ncbi:hypothetical protein [Paenibacillus glycinis]|uniref:Uncharacterized protein n=1 Tax=Paenibacillus glycinis TaxID=2697035 RepID=A0ABW9XWK2_9BACL|nr:hypothetical protein [Paenibacillus glycinis]NBD26901.1 hypothetical protein [Paenibacillus glycinis]